MKDKVHCSVIVSSQFRSISQSQERAGQQLSLIT